MTDIQKLKALAQKQINPANWFKPGEKVEGLESEDLEFIAAANPALVLELITEVERLKQHETANAEWQEKTEWVQETGQWYELGMHRADVLRKRCDDAAFHQQAQAGQLVKLIAENQALRKDAERYRFVVDCPIRTMVALGRKAHEADFDLSGECDRLMERSGGGHD